MVFVACNMSTLPSQTPPSAPQVGQGAGFPELPPYHASPSQSAPNADEGGEQAQQGAAPALTLQRTAEEPSQKRPKARHNASQGTKQPSFISESTLWAVESMVRLDVNLAFVRPMVNMFTKAVSGVLPREVSAPEFTGLMCRVFLANLVEKVKSMNASIDLCHSSTPFPFTPMPTLFWHIIGGFKPIAAEPGVSPLVCVNTIQLVGEVDAWMEHHNTKHIQKDILALHNFLQYQTLIAKKLSRDPWTTTESSSSILDVGYLPSADPEVGHQKFVDGVLVEGEEAPFVPVEVVAKRRLARRMEVVVAVAKQRTFYQPVRTVQMYLPHVKPDEAALVALSGCFARSREAISESDIIRDAYLAELNPGRV